MIKDIYKIFTDGSLDTIHIKTGAVCFNQQSKRKYYTPSNSTSSNWHKASGKEHSSYKFFILTEKNICFKNNSKSIRKKQPNFFLMDSHALRCDGEWSGRQAARTTAALSLKLLLKHLFSSCEWSPVMMILEEWTARSSE